MSDADFGLLDPEWAGTAAAAATSDTAFVQALLDVEAAWVAVQADAGLCGQDAADALDAAADVSLYDLPAIAGRGAGGGNPLIPLLADLRAEVARATAGTETAGTGAAGAGSAGTAVHRGATSQDIVDTALMLLACRAGALIRDDLARAADALAALARDHRETVCVARSLTQHALPTTFGLRAANWLSGVVQAGRALDAVLARLPLQWGGAVGTQAALADLLAARPGTAHDAGPAAPAHDDPATAGPAASALTAALAERLGLADPGTPWHTNRLPVASLGAALAGVAAAAGKVAADVLVLSRPEIAEVSEPRGEGRGGSSAMPQKQNPVLSVLIRRAALGAPQQVAQLFLAAGTAVDERPDGSWHAEWAPLRELLRQAGGAAAKLAELAAGLEVKPRAMARNASLSGDLLVSERIMARCAPLVEGGKPAIQALVRASLSEGAALRPLLRAAIPTAKLSDAEFEDLLDPAGYLGQAGTFIDLILADRDAWGQA